MQYCIDTSIQLEDYIKNTGKTDYRHQRQYRQVSTEKITWKKWEEKQLYVHFKKWKSKISHEKTWTWLYNVNEISSDSRTKQLQKDCVKARLDKTQDSMCILCGDRDEIINHISEYSKLAQKEHKTRHDWVGKVIEWELYKKFKFDHTNQCYMHNPESVQENETQKVLWDFEIQTEHLV